MFCTKCGNKITESEATFCPNCGHKRAVAQETPQEASQEAVKEPQDNAPTQSTPDPAYRKINSTERAALEKELFERAMKSARNTKSNYSYSYAPGRKILLVVGILYIIFGGFGIIGGFVGIAMPDYAIALLDWTLPLGRASWRTYYYFGVIFSIYDILLGIMGIAYSNNILKANLLLGLAIGYAVAYAIFLIAIGFAAMSALNGMWMLPFGFVLPTLYIIGAVKNRM